VSHLAGTLYQCDTDGKRRTWEVEVESALINVLKEFGLPGLALGAIGYLIALVIKRGIAIEIPPRRPRR
jgi:hypothetical protein